MAQITFREAMDDFLHGCIGMLEPNTTRFYMNQLKQLVKWCEREDITLECFRARHMRGYLAYRATNGGGGSLAGKPVSESTRRKDAIAAKVFFQFCKGEGYVEDDPLRDFKPPKAPKPYVKMPSADELARLLAAVSDFWNAEHNPPVRYKGKSEREFYRYRDYAILSTLIATGARISEVLDIRLVDVDLAQGQMAVREAKDDEPRILPLSDRLTKTLKDWTRRRGKWWKKLATDRLFTSWEGERLEGFGDQFRQYAKWAGVDGFTLHGLKHFAATTLYETAPWMAEAVTGTSQATLRKHYVHRNVGYVRDKYADADPLGKVLRKRPG